MVKIMNELRSTIVGLLRETKREGILKLVAWMEINGFFTAPCSGGNHLAVEGGLAEHSYNVFHIMDSMAMALCEKEHHDMINSIIICSLLHDLGKVGDYGKPGYVPNMIKDGRPTKGEPEQKYKRSETKPYDVNKDLLYVPHEVRSVSIASKFITLTEDEYFAILYHNGLYGDFKYDIQGKETPLYLLLHMADMWCSRIVELKERGND
jgi:23S rRNA maturation-related 3'-5' exoribonuclease YhaM